MRIRKSTRESSPGGAWPAKGSQLAICTAKREADAIVSADPALEQPDHGGLRDLALAVPAARAILISS